MTDRRPRPVPELDERDLDGVPLVALAALLALLDAVEDLRPLTDEEQSTRETVTVVREARNQLVEERFGRGTTHPAGRLMPRSPTD